MTGPVKSAEVTSPDGLAPASDREQIDRCLADALAEARRIYAVNPKLVPLFDRMTAAAPASTLPGQLSDRLGPVLGPADRRLAGGGESGGIPCLHADPR